MSDPQTVNIGLSVPTRGSDVGVWDTPVNGDFSAIDGMFGGVQTISVSNAPVTLTAPAGFAPTPSGGPTQAQNMALKFTGALTSSVTVTLPIPGMYIVHNLVQSGFLSFALIFAAASAGQVVSTCPGTAQRIYNDGTNVYLVDLPPVGAFLDLYATSVPAWINACTVPPYLYCNGGTFNGTTYPFLAALLGSLSLPDLRGRSRACFNDGTGRIAANGINPNGDQLGVGGGSSTVSIQMTNLPASPAPINASTSGYTPSIPGFVNAVGLNNVSPIAAGTGGAGAISNTSSQAAIQGFSSLSVGSNSANLGNGTVTPTMNPVCISGITMIRAA